MSNCAPATFASRSGCTSLTGDVCGERSFLPLETEVEPGKPVVLAPDGGRSSNGAFPFFNVQYGDEGLITAIGWSGQWRASLERSAAGPDHLARRHGEDLLEPASRREDPHAAHPHHAVEGRPARGAQSLPPSDVVRVCAAAERPPAARCRSRCNASIATSASAPDWGTEAGQLRAARAAYNAGCDTHWLDAAWFEGGFPNGVGNWFCPPQRFPNGLKPVSDACHQLGLKFIVWFEPERVAPGTQIAREHPEFVFGGDKGGLFKLSDPAARAG